jgi:cell wall-associated NlpC family hydrolase
MITFADIEKEARSWVGTRFKKGGRDRTGIDCVGLLVNVGRACGVELNDDTGYSFNPESEMFLDLVYGQSDVLPVTGLTPGSILLFRQSIFPMHTGILSRDKYKRLSVINANLMKRQVVEQPLDEWKNLLIGVRAYRGVNA